MHIDQFIQQYSESEADKITRPSNALDRFKNKSILQNIAIKRSDSIVETKPIGSPPRKASPPRKLSPPMRR